MRKKKSQKTIIPCRFMGITKHCTPYAGHELTMYPMHIPNWVSYPVSLRMAQDGVYDLRGEIVAVYAVLDDLRPLTAKVAMIWRWRMLVFKLRRIFKR